MGGFYWVLDERKFFEADQLLRLRRSVRGRVERAGFNRLPWVEWFLIELAFDGGLRVFEMAALRCSDLVLNVSRRGVFVRRGKGGRPRFVRIRRSFAEACVDFLEWKQAAGESVDAEAPLFLSPVTGGHLTTRALQKVFARCCKRVHVTDHSVHHARHTYCSHLYKSSKHNLRMVQRQAGHSSIRTTEVYAHVFDQDLERAVEKLYA